MEKIVVGVADDLKSVHDMFQKFLEPYRNEIEIKDFYFTSQVDDFLRKTPNGLDMLFLDVLFEGSTSGIDALPDLRKKAPDLPITLLTAQHFPSEGIDIRSVCKEYKVDVVVMGSDWDGSDKFDYLKEYCEVVYLDRTEGISTTKIKNDLGLQEPINGIDQIPEPQGKEE